ncbi:MAG: OsmC family protein [Fimbriimonadales bacterium]
MVTVDLVGEMAFEAHTEGKVSFVMDAYPEAGGEGRGATPVETLLAAIGACSGMDVISILRKKKQTVTSYRIEVDGERVPQGEWPRPFRSIEVRHVVKGEGLDPAAVARAVELSDEKYCSVIATLRSSPSVKSTWRIEESP